MFTHCIFHFVCTPAVASFNNTQHHHITFMYMQQSNFIHLISFRARYFLHKQNRTKCKHKRNPQDPNSKEGREGQAFTLKLQLIQQTNFNSTLWVTVQKITTLFERNRERKGNQIWRRKRMPLWSTRKQQNWKEKLFIFNISEKIND